MRKLIIILLMIFTTGQGAFVGTISEEQVKSVEKMAEFFKQYEKDQEILKLESSKLTIQNLYRYMELIGVRDKKIVLRQIILESGWLRSSLTRRYNNLLGMKLARIRPTLASGQALGHAKFNHWTDSVKDYVLWRIYWENKGHNTSNYYKFLKHIGYAESKIYIATLKSINVDREINRIHNNYIA